MKNLWTSARLRWLAAAWLMVNGFFPLLWMVLTSFKAES